MSKSTHTGLGIALGAALGVVAGVLAGHIAVWLGIGIAIGMALARRLQASTEDVRSAPLCTRHMKRIRRSYRAKAQKGVHHAITGACFHISPGQP
jgi:hypothetical protein